MSSMTIISCTDESKFHYVSGSIIAKQHAAVNGPCVHCAVLEMQAEISKLNENVHMALVALKLLCEPVPDGIGGFVADEFTEEEVLIGRRAIKAIEEGI